ncbi:MAG: GNAT family N-acetyltransferase [Pseudomonadota bacterium]
MTGRTPSGRGALMSVRPARREDAAAMAALINPIIAKGGATAYEEPLGPPYFAARIDALAPPFSAHVAEADGRLIGFQFMEPHDNLPEDTGDMASFVALDAGRSGVGRALFAASSAAARAAGLRALQAYVRADNEVGLAYYEAMGFRTRRIDAAIPLKDGTPVDRVAKLLVL